MGRRYVHNRNCMPQLHDEGAFGKNLIANIALVGKETWKEGLSPFERVHIHQTLASTRRFAHFHPFSVKKDELDFVLATNYNHSEEQFPDQIDVYLQPETVNKSNTLKMLRNLRKVEPFKTKIMTRISENATTTQKDRIKQSKKLNSKFGEGKLPYRYNFAHPVLIGGIIDKVHPSNVKLMNSSHHTSQTNAGYSRQDSDGNLYQY